MHIDIPSDVKIFPSPSEQSSDGTLVTYCFKHAVQCAIVGQAFVLELTQPGDYYASCPVCEVDVNVDDD